MQDLTQEAIIFGGPAVSAKGGTESLLCCLAGYDTPDDAVPVALEEDDTDNTDKPSSDTQSNSNTEENGVQDNKKADSSDEMEMECYSTDQDGKALSNSNSHSFID